MRIFIFLFISLKLFSGTLVTEWYYGYTCQETNLQNYVARLNIEYPNYTHTYYAIAQCKWNVQRWTKDAVPTSCDWATIPPWNKLDSSFTEPVCDATKINDLYGSGTPRYSTKAKWCSYDQSCYAKFIGCPAGKVYDKVKKHCYAPDPNSDGSCPTGYSITNYSIGLDANGVSSEKCYSRYLCKTNKTIEKTFQVSCGATPEDLLPYTTPDGESTDSLDSTNKSLPTSKTMNSTNITNLDTSNTDLATNSTVNNASNKLSSDIDQYLGKYLSDGGVSHLQYLRDAADTMLSNAFEQTDLIDKINNSMDSQLVLTSDVNTNLQTINDTSTAGLVLQADANEHLSNLNNTASNINDTLNGGGDFNGTALDFTDASTPDSSITTAIQNMMNDVSSISTEFTNLKNIISGNFNPPVFDNGLCMSFTGPFGISVNMNSLANVISPYASIMSILIYISLMIMSFRHVFSFLSRGVS